MTDHELELRLRSWYRDEIPADEAAPTALRSMVAAITNVSPTPLRRVGSGRGLRLLAAAAVLTSATVAGALLAGSGLIDPPAVVAPSDAPSTAPSPETTATAEAGRIVYTHRVRLADGEGDCVTRFVFCHRASVFIANADGSDPRELVPGPSSVLLSASADGARLLVMQPEADRFALFLTDSNGAALQRLDIPCEVPCYKDGDSGFALSPDGTRLAFSRAYAEILAVPPYQIDTRLIAVMDLATGVVDELQSTLGVGAAPGWSPDGSRLAFGNHVVDVDVGNLRQIAPADLFTGFDGEFIGSMTPPQWSGDGSVIAFASNNDTLVNTTTDRNSQRLMDIYVVRPDGSGLQRLTTDTAPPLGTTDPGDFGAAFPTWTRDGRITFTRFPMPPATDFEFWVMNADGSSALRLDPSDPAALTALGCTACTYPALTDYDVPNFAYWIPAQ